MNRIDELLDGPLDEQYLIDSLINTCQRMRRHFNETEEILHRLARERNVDITLDEIKQIPAIARFRECEIYLKPILIRSRRI